MRGSFGGEEGIGLLSSVSLCPQAGQRIFTTLDLGFE